MIVDCHVNVFEDRHVSPLLRAETKHFRPGAPELKADPDTVYRAMAGVDKAIVFSLRYADSSGIDGDDEVTAQYCAVDAGAAMANLAIEAVSRGLVSHPMAGFDADRARVAFDIPPQVQLFVVIAVGSLADHAAVSADIADRDATPRKRLPLKDVAFRETWGEPWRA